MTWGHRRRGRSCRGPQCQGLRAGMEWRGSLGSGSGLECRDLEPFHSRPIVMCAGIHQDSASIKGSGA